MRQHPLVKVDDPPAAAVHASLSLVGLCTRRLTPPRLAARACSRLADPPPPGEGSNGTLSASLGASKTRRCHSCIGGATSTVTLPWRGRVAAERTRGGGVG